MSRREFSPVAPPAAVLAALLLIAAAAGGVRGGNAAQPRKLAAGGSGNSNAAAELVKGGSAEGDGLVVKDSAPSSASGGEAEAQIPPLQLILAEEGRAEGAVCLDGSAPGFYYRKGYGSGQNNWVLYYEGGAWCASPHACAWRARTHLGSTDHARSAAEMVERENGSMNGMLSANRTVNPEQVKPITDFPATTTAAATAGLKAQRGSTALPLIRLFTFRRALFPPALLFPYYAGHGSRHQAAVATRLQSPLLPPRTPGILPCPRACAIPVHPPGFYNWNAVYFIYCDGGSFAGDQDEPIYFNVSHLPLRLSALIPLHISTYPPLCLSLATSLPLPRYLSASPSLPLCLSLATSLPLPRYLSASPSLPLCLSLATSLPLPRYLSASPSLPLCLALATSRLPPPPGHSAVPARKASGGPAGEAPSGEEGAWPRRQGGCFSAGGVAALLHCDRVRDTLTAASPSMHVRCLADASMFLDIPDVNNTRRVANFFAEVHDMHNLTASLPEACVKEREPEKHHECFMASHILQHVSTPLFLINSNYEKVATTARQWPQQQLLSSTPTHRHPPLRHHLHRTPHLRTPSSSSPASSTARYTPICRGLCARQKEWYVPSGLCVAVESC
ncbi:unnamed protein product [Closterium sp. Naga37s-1]|nr:unnamed protein product [Closterium sp. Naga37s-1]